MHKPRHGQSTMVYFCIPTVYIMFLKFYKVGTVTVLKVLTTQVSKPGKCSLSGFRNPESEHISRISLRNRDEIRKCFGGES